MDMVWSEAAGFWVVRSQKLASSMLRDPHLEVVQQPQYSTAHVPDSGAQLTVHEFFGSWFSRSPRHAQVRREIAPPYAARAVDDLEELFRRTANDCLADLPSSGDLMSDYFSPFGTLSTARMLGVPDDQWAIISKVVGIITDFVKKPLATSFVATQSEMRAMETSILYLRRLVDHLLVQRDPGPLVAALQRLVQTEDGSEWLAVTTIGQLLAAGVEPMTNGAGLACRELFANPGVEEAVRSGRIRADQVAEEALRLSPPFLSIHRWAQSHCDCLGVPVRPGDHVVVDVRAVNRDPAVVEAPDEFLPERPRHLNMTFGRGPHTCLGLFSGRLQIAVALEELLALDPRARVEVARAEVLDIGYQVSVPSIPFTREGSVPDENTQTPGHRESR